MRFTLCRRLILLLIAVCTTSGVLRSIAAPQPEPANCRAPAAVRPIGNGKRMLVLGSTPPQAIVLDGCTGEPIESLPLPAEPADMAIDGGIAYITTREPAGRILALDLRTMKCTTGFHAGHSPTSPVLSPDGATLCVANRFDNTISIVEMSTGSKRDVEVIREPIALAMSSDGRRLFVANHLPEVRPFLDDENPYIGAEVSVVDIETARAIRHIPLPNGSQGLRGIAISPDQRYVVVTHILSHYTMPTMRIEQGAMNMNAISLIDAQTLQWYETVILDDPDSGAANPWAAAFSRDGRELLVTHAGTHELSVIDFRALLARLRSGRGARGIYGPADLHTMAGIRRRIPLPVAGPRTLAVRDALAYIAGYFSNDLAIVDLAAVEPSVRCVSLAPEDDVPEARLGEQYFNDASLCRQQWQSCATCHPDGRSDVMYWDLLNDGIGNTKNTKSLLMSALTPPAMWRGVRKGAAEAIVAGMHHIQFADVPPKKAAAIEKYLLHMKSVPSPFLDASQAEPPRTEPGCAKCHSPGVPRGVLTPSALRGKAIFEGKAGCVTCHPHPNFTVMQEVDPGLGSGVLYDVPTLIEVWRTAPYLHSGDALTLRETITDFNLMQKRGRTRDLAEQEVNDLIEYLKSL